MPRNPDAKRFKKILKDARKKAKTSRSYSSAKTRADLVSTFELARPGKTPYSWQIDISEALILGLDCLLVAGTGAGKTMPMGMPLLLPENKDQFVLILSPLKELERDQAAGFNEINLPATAVNGENWLPGLLRDIKSHKHRVLLTSPEMALDHPGFSALMRSPDFMKNCMAIVVDEAHCISEWGADFRKQYAELQRLRAMVPLGVPFMAASATLPPTVRSDVQAKLGFVQSNTFQVNLGNDRPNITPFVCRMKTSRDIGAIDFMVQEAVDGGELVSSILFVNTRDLARDTSKHLRTLVPAGMHNQIDFLHAGRSTRAKRRVMRRFRAGKIKILCATEAAGMGMDIRHVVRVVQFMVPSSLSVWKQRKGRAGRDGRPSIGVLLVEPSVYQRRKKAKPRNKGKKKAAQQPRPSDDTDGELSQDQDSVITDDEPEEPAVGEYEHKKKVEDGMRRWIETLACRREVNNEYFENPPRTTAPTVACCDNCLLRKGLEAPDTLSPDEAALLAYIKKVKAQVRHVPESDAEDDNKNEDIKPEPQPKPKPVRRPGPRRGEPLASCREALLKWRRSTWRTNHSSCAWDETVLLEDKDLTVLASRARIRTQDDLKTEMPGWDFAGKYGEEVLGVLRTVDERYVEERRLADGEREAKRLRVLNAKPVVHPWQPPPNRPFGHFWSFALHAWLPIPQQHEAEFY